MTKLSGQEAINWIKTESHTGEGLDWDLMCKTINAQTLASLMREGSMTVSNDNKVVWVEEEPTPLYSQAQVINNYYYPPVSNEMDLKIAEVRANMEMITARIQSETAIKLAEIDAESDRYSQQATLQHEQQIISGVLQATQIFAPIVAAGMGIPMIPPVTGYQFGGDRQ